MQTPALYINVDNLDAFFNEAQGEVVKEFVDDGVDNNDLSDALNEATLGVMFSNMIMARVYDKIRQNITFVNNI